MNLVKFLLGLCFIASSLVAGEPITKAPIPTEQEQADALRLIKDIFKEDYSKATPGDKVSLAKKLLSQAIETNDSMPTKYVLLNEARALSIQAREPDTTFITVGEITKVFAVDFTALRSKTLDEISRQVVTPEACVRVAEEYLSFVEVLILTESIQEGLKASSSAEQVAKRAKSMPLVIKAQEQTKRIRLLQTELQKISLALNTLKENPDDPKSNETVGQFKCFIKRDWDSGLPLLEKGTNVVLKDLAVADVARPADTQSQLKIGDAWWEFGQKSAYKAAIIERAQMWYLLCRPNLSGLMRTKVDSRLTVLPAALSSTAATGTLVAKLLQGKTTAQGLPN